MGHIRGLGGVIVSGGATREVWIEDLPRTSSLTFLDSSKEGMFAAWVGWDDWVEAMAKIGARLYSWAEKWCECAYGLLDREAAYLGNWLICWRADLRSVRVAGRGVGVLLVGHVGRIVSGEGYSCG
jgi:hypothetical protein